MTILKEYTDTKHREVEDTDFIKYLLSGNIKEEDYVSYLFELFYIYSTLENLAKKHNLLDGMEGIERAAAIEKDLTELNPSFSRDLLPSTKNYINHLFELSEKTPELLFAHVYVRHMGDLYGGKLIARLVPGSGLMYQFEDRSSLVKVFNEKLNIELKDEALVSFDFFKEIFTDLWNLLNKK